jgi:hypothetical protein
MRIDVQKEGSTYRTTLICEACGARIPFESGTIGELWQEHARVSQGCPPPPPGTTTLRLQKIDEN